MSSHKSDHENSQRKENSKRKYRAHYISGTHWDREWYRPFQEFRFLLVSLMDRLIDLMEKSGDFKFFHLDGQTCVLQDYLEIRPEMRPRLSKLIEDGRILIGPWYTMPDLFCPGAEALVRNLLIGQRVSREWGVEPMKVAYTCDMFGHPSQMPQVYRGFDMPYCVLGRGTNEHTTPAFFRWKAADGSSVFTFKLQDTMGYGAFVGSRKILEQSGEGLREAGGGGENGADKGAGRRATDRRSELETEAKQSLRRFIGHEMNRTNGNTLCLIDAVDHMPPATDASRTIRIVEEACPEVRAEHSALPLFFEDAEKGAVDVIERQGELREPAKQMCTYLWLIPNCVSSRMRMKQANDECQTLLESWVEPWTAIAAVEGIPIHRRFLETAWEHVILNHAHDSICGCSIDQVHRDMMYRFDQARILARQLRTRAFGDLTARCADPSTREHEFTVTIANPAPRERREVVVFPIDLPVDFPTQYKEGFRSQMIKSFRLLDRAGAEIPYQRLSLVPERQERSEYAVYASPGSVASVRVDVAAEISLPAMGFTSLVVAPSDTPVRRMGSLRTGPCAAENEHLRVAVQPNGSLILTDKSGGEEYRDLLLFEDRGEIGDGWFHAEPVSTESALSSGANAQVSVVHDGPELVTFRVALFLDVPKRYDWRKERRSDERGKLEIVNLVTLMRGEKTLIVETVVENPIEDHCLRLLLPTDAAGAETYFAHHPFDVVERDIQRNPETESWEEMEIVEKPFLDFQAVCHGKRGLAFLSAGGLHEGGVAEDQRRTMQVTLLRSYRRTVATLGEEDGLERGQITYRYNVMPIRAPLPRSEIFHELSKLKAGVMTRQTGDCPSGYPAMTGSLPPEQGFLSLRKGDLVLSAFKQAEDGNGVILRLWNPHPEIRTEELAFWKEIKHAAPVNLGETREEELELSYKERTISVSCPPFKIVTIRANLA